MANKALGLIETVGLAAAVEAADAAAKAAAVTLIGYELTKGGGMVVVKLAGDVGAVKAAVEAGTAAARRVGRVWAAHIIPRPHAEITPLVRSPETKGCRPESPGEASKPATGPEAGAGCQPPEPTAGATAAETPVVVQDAVRTQPGGEEQVCNLCQDPACPRRKGDARTICIHYQKRPNKED